MSRVEEHMDKACSLLREGKLRDAITEYKQALEIDPENAIAHKSLGSIYYRLTMLDESISEFELAVKHHPRYADAYYELGVSLYRRGRLEDSIKSFEKAV